MRSLKSSMRGFVITSNEDPHFWLLAFFARRRLPWNDIRVRKAANLCIDANVPDDGLALPADGARQPHLRARAIQARQSDIQLS